MKQCTLLWLLLMLLTTGHARARPEQQQASADEPLEAKPEDGHSLTAPRPADDELATVAPTTTPVPAVAITQGAATGAATEAPHSQPVVTAVPATSSTSTSTTVPAPLLPAAPEQPEYLKHCFYADEHLCMYGHDGQGNEAPDALGHISTTPESDSQGIGLQVNASQGNSQNLERNANSCQCHEHPAKANSWYCCNISQMSMISSCSNISKWTNLHVRNLTVRTIDLSNPIFRSLQSLAVTDGNITRLINAFPRHSALKCLNISNNNISEIPSRMFKDVPHLEFFGMSRNNLSLVPHHNQNKNITVDISGNMRMLCNPLNEIINNDSFNFVNPKHSYCLYNATHEWFQSTDLVSVEQLESTKRCMTKCPVIPNYGSCKCRFESIMIIQDDQSKPKCHVDCSNLGLVELPPRLPDNTLVADNNQISSIYEFEGTKFIENFQRIYMRNNSLSKIPEYFLNNALMDTGRRIYLAGNKLQCDCNSAKTLQNWLKERSTDIPDYMEIRCRNIPQSVIELQEAKLCQSPPDWTDYIYYLIAAEVILLLGLITKVSYDYWVFKTSGYLPWPASKMPKLPCDWLCES
ncbi:GL14268 [Drosophila persimilis]|uniref:GL14268 n=1 Tax=Drosophila persimilis TaxID=7234 RepID=B4GTJ2_DROPE|nr:GL14268 [Drosophila persimilis]